MSSAERVAGRQFAVTQAARPGASCTYSISPASTYFYRAGGSGAVTINTQPGCPWSAVKDAAWVTFTTAASGTGSAVVNYSVAQNPAGGMTRLGLVTVAGQRVEIQQFSF